MLERKPVVLNIMAPGSLPFLTDALQHPRTAGQNISIWMISSGG